MKRLSLFFSLLVEAACVKTKFNFPRQDEWSPWEQWTECTKTKLCYSGSRFRQRKCLKENRLCIGVVMESENCPVKDCQPTLQTIVLDVTEAPLSSFISQECDTDMKFSLVGTQGHLVPSHVRKIFEKHLNKFEAGYFNKKNLLHKNIKNVTKYCFEPRHVSYREAKEIYYTNRTTKSSIDSHKGDISADNLIDGFSIVVSMEDHLVVAVYFTVKTSNVGYVVYRRWRGTGFAEAL